jgi:GTP diphosphokinase / guanosine-3',5'-bis(diphosphate) 3'-diphosphatase
MLQAKPNSNMAAAYDISHQWEEPEGLHDLLQSIRDRRPTADLKKIRFAYFIAEQAHAGQDRVSGEPYIIHPLAVAQTVADLGMDDDSIVASLLHDVLEDSHTFSHEYIRDTFGEDVLDLVEGVTKLRLREATDLTDRQRAAAETARTAESLRKMLLAMARDPRVMIIKLSDRLHNMQTLEALPEDKRMRIASETLDIYAPLAARLGIWQLKWQLEDLGFKYLHPDEYAHVEELVKRSRGERERDLNTAVLQLKERLEQRKIKAEVKGRPKHLYSIFNKMAKQGIPFEEIYDLLALRIIVGDTGDCYQVLGIVHELWVPIPGLFTDYIARPKPNGYQSLHTKVLGPNGQSLEVQIRTRHMHETAEHGVAAHWTYKEGGKGMDEAAKLQSLRQQLLDWSSDARTSSDFLRSVSTDLFSEQVFIFTPKGDVLDLPRGSTPIDFAFRVHTKLGLTLIGAKVNGSMAPLNTQLKNGDVVELITRSNAQPSLDWLEYVQSAHTKSKLRAYFRKISKDDDALRGREALEKELRSFKLDPKTFLTDDRLGALVKHYHGVETATDVLAKVGAGLISVQGAVMKLRGLVQEAPVEGFKITRTDEGKLKIGAGAMDGVMVKRAKCCDPVPGDEVVGYITRGKGIMIHRKVCPNAMALQTTDGERLVPYDWPPDGSGYPVMLKIVTVNRQGLLMDISTIFGESKTNVSAAKIKTMPNHTAEIEVQIDVTDTQQLAAVMNKISNFSDVISNHRMFGRTAGK